MNQNGDVVPTTGSSIGLRRTKNGEWIVTTNGEENEYQTLGAALDSLRAQRNLASGASTTLDNTEITKLREENKKLRNCIAWLTMRIFEKDGGDGNGDAERYHR